LIDEKQYRWDTLLTRRLQLAALEARMIAIPGSLALEQLGMSRKRPATLTPRRMVTAVRM
jgi:hypothetical protein